MCAHHYPKGEDSSDDEWPSDISDDQIDDASDDEEKKKGYESNEDEDSSEDDEETKGSSEDKPLEAGKEITSADESDN